MQSYFRGGALALICLVAALTGSSALAQNYPNRPIHFIVGFAAGGPNDIVARILIARGIESVPSITATCVIAITP